ncbi:MAG: MarR family transcriptional regulator [Bacteroidota bacterium]
MKPEETIDFNIRWAWHRIARYYNSKAAKYDSTMSVGYTLLNIDLEEGTPSTKLGPKMGMEPRSLTRMLKSMEEKGLIYRESGKEDRRTVRIFLTELGKEKREISKETVIKFNLAVRKKIPENKLKDFFKIINQLNGILENT